MISSLVWLYLLQIGRISPKSAPWLVYLPVCIVEVAVYFYCLFKWGDK